ncbi:MAG: hypothetical protein AB8B83_01435, partial [Bdellovibrionales bacterium]
MALDLSYNGTIGIDASPINRLAVFKHVVQGQNPSFLIETDIRNASGLNQAIDRSGTDSVMQIYCMMQLKALNALNPDLLYVAKPNGDEIT